ncbi:hypothetical protein [Sporisorium scitamineum]|uniref:Uncharacterized protein n=1 Tax=Sporisorium scitamineum TaxID=49012 RepID=A0A0F7SDG8_9BASI|nr:hypothetical protein [Sporisorium scitamineum]
MVEYGRSPYSHRLEFETSNGPFLQAMVFVLWVTD